MTRAWKEAKFIGVGAGFNRLVALDPHEIQVGILKRLRGAPISRHTTEFDCRYNPHPPYNLLCSALLDFATLRRLERFARFWWSATPGDSATPVRWCWATIPSGDSWP